MNMTKINVSYINNKSHYIFRTFLTSITSVAKQYCRHKIIFLILALLQYLDNFFNTHQKEGVLTAKVVRRKRRQKLLRNINFNLFHLSRNRKFFDNVVVRGRPHRNSARNAHTNTYQHNPHMLQYGKGIPDSRNSREHCFHRPRN